MRRLAKSAHPAHSSCPPCTHPHTVRPRPKCTLPHIPCQNFNMPTPVHRRIFAMKNTQQRIRSGGGSARQGRGSTSSPMHLVELVLALVVWSNQLATSNSLRQMRKGSAHSKHNIRAAGHVVRKAAHQLARRAASSAEHGWEVRRREQTSYRRPSLYVNTPRPLQRFSNHSPSYRLPSAHTMKPRPVIMSSTHSPSYLRSVDTRGQD